MTFRVNETRLPVLNHYASRVPLYPHQAAMFDGWQEYSTMLLAAKTGTGKTRAAMLPVLKRREWAVAIYPTNELVKDQMRAVEQFAKEEGIAALTWTPEMWTGANRAATYARAEHVLVPVDGFLLDEWQQVTHCKSRGEILRRILDPDKPKIIFTNPDILFLILGLQYHAEPFEALRRYETLVIDEFHLYQGVELAHALAMVALARGFEIFRRLILLSATPHPEVRTLLDQAFAPVPISMQLLAGQSSQSWRTAVHSVEVTPIQVTGEDPVEVLVSRIVDLKSQLERLRREVSDSDYIPAVVIVNSVLSAIRLEDRLVGLGFDRNSLAIIRGLSHRSIRETGGKLLALGTSAIEVGVDFRCDYLLFEASEAASFLQRFGRVGRHRPGKAIALVPPNSFQGMSMLPSRVERAAFEERIYAWYPSATAHPWFVTTEHGVITARMLAENLIATVERDSQARPEILTQLRRKVDAILERHTERLSCSAKNSIAKAAFQRCAAGKEHAQWLNTYRCLNRFRTSLPSITVHDFMEQHRRQEWNMGEYECDLAMLLKRGADLAWNGKLGMLTIKGIGGHHRVHASEMFTDEDCGLILETKDFPNLLLYQDSKATPVADIMARQNHIFTIAAKADVEEERDWRLSVFESGKYVLAFDGAALLLLELARRRSRNPSDVHKPTLD